nr:hypothetical protein [Rhizobium phaseoli]
MRDGKRRPIMARGLPAAAEYLRQGAETQLSGAFAGHTPDGGGDICEIPIYAGELESSIILPDRPGEEWVRFYRERRWPAEWASFLGADTSCLIFLRANSRLNQAPLDWITIQRFQGNSANLAKDEDASGAGTPTQVLIVDLIQMLFRLARKVGNAHFRIGVVVSAWDTVSPEEQTAGPFAYLNAEFPMLGSFLRSAATRSELMVFGLSVFDGDFDNQAEFRHEFQTVGNPRDRGSVVIDDLRGNIFRTPDLTEPVAWSLGVNAA